MQQGLIDAIESILKDQVQLASEINSLAISQYSAILGTTEFSVEEADRLLAMTTKLEMLETERHAMLTGSSVTMEDLVPLSASLKDLMDQLRDGIAAMRESVKKNMAILDVQILRTRSMFESVRHATGNSDEAVEYGPKGKVKRGSGGSLLGAG